MAKLTNSEVELQCVGRLEVVRPRPVGFLCGSIPVPTDKSFQTFNSALVPSSETVTAPRYRMLPTETDLNTPPLFSSLPERVLPSDYHAVQSRATNGDVSWDSGAITSNLARKGESLAVSGLVEYGDEIDVIAPADILKQIFKMPYSKARLSIAVHRIGQTLVLNAGPDVEEGERLVKRNQPKCADQSLFLNFAMHSVRMEACDCPPFHSAAPSEGQSKSSALPDLSQSRKSSFSSSSIQRNDAAPLEGDKQHMDNSEVKQESFYWGGAKNKRNKGHGPVKKASQIGGKPRSSMQESEKYRRGGNDEFVRVLFWQFHNFRMLLGSDLLLFSNEKYVAVSLHLWDVSRQVTPLTWLEAWLDNVMASVPELAICYHQDGVVQGYELLRTDDVFLLKGISEDGTPAFHPYVVQQNGLSVLRFLQENCKQDPGAYWLYKSAGEDVIQLFDLSVIPQNHPSDNYDSCSSSLPSLIRKGRTDSLLSLGTLLYRIGHRLSLSMAPNNRPRCARFLRKCIELLDEPDHLVILAFAHEQFARFILNNDEELNLTAEAFSLVSEVRVTDAEEESLDIISSISDSTIHGLSSVDDESPCEDLKKIQISINGAFGENNLGTDASESRSLIAAGAAELKCLSELVPSCMDDESFAVCNVLPPSAPVIQTVADPISSKLAAVHHVSQAIKSLKWMRQTHNTDSELVDKGETVPSTCPTKSFSVCACGDTECIELCDIREWLPTMKLDRKLWKLVLLLGESYLALGEAYKEDDQLLKALKVLEIACSVYGSVPQHLEDTRFISSMVSSPLGRTRLNDGHKKKQSIIAGEIRLSRSSSSDYATLEHSSTYLFWSKAWTLVGDVHVEFYTIQGKEMSAQLKQKPSGRELKMSSEVVEELVRLKKTLSQDKEYCNSCSLVNCSCQGDRASSGNSASSSSGDAHANVHSRRQSKRSYPKSGAALLARQGEDDCVGVSSEGGNMGHKGNVETLMQASKILDGSGEKSSVPTIVCGAGATLEIPTTTASRDLPKSGNGGIFKYLGGPISTDCDDILSAALSCYKQARKALNGIHVGSKELEAVLKKIGWVCNELGRSRLEKKNLAKAELAFADAIDAFKEVSDHTNIILINCNLGHGRRAVAEELVSKMEYLKTNVVFGNAYVQTLETAKTEYARSLGFYGAAKSELVAVVDGADDVSLGLRNEVYTQFAHTCLRLGMLLAREDTTAEVYENGASGDTELGFRGPKQELRKHEISANDAIREALSIYESLGELRKQEAAYAYFQLACYQRDCCFKFLDSNQRSSYPSKSENSILQRVKRYASLAERNWQKAIEFYSANTHPIMYLTIVMERSSLSLSLSSSFHSHAILETALSCLLEGRHISIELCSDLTRDDKPEIYAKFWSQLQMLLKKMLALALSQSSNKSGSASPSTSLKRSADADKLRELYKMSLKAADFCQLHAMHNLWTSFWVLNVVIRKCRWLVHLIVLFLGFWSYAILSLNKACMPKSAKGVASLGCQSKGKSSDHSTNARSAKLPERLKAQEKEEYN
ncbi:hypothetical protein Nepgr_024255 [Nepenthes gracilis]|uniref:EDRF1 N-terminal domain-containing protein n=1 Tax=Nepenthes gracilis TaxID=150966 RepID=A0AAD3T5N2_NEPGR|nr:hypothetical protein Nepgr_024255 [Nepenthes gracilis]